MRNPSIDPKAYESLPSRIVINKSEMTLGRGRLCDIVLDSKLKPSLVSKVHAVLYTTIIPASTKREKAMGLRQFEIQLSDVKSTNGTFVDGQKVTSKPGFRITLKHGSRIVLGSIKIDHKQENSSVKNDQKHQHRIKLSEICYELDTKTEQESRLFKLDIHLRAQKREKELLVAKKKKKKVRFEQEHSKIDKDNINWNSIQSLKSTLEKVMIPTKTPGLVGEMRRRELKKRVIEYLG